jgi:hypothetical protein
MPKRVVDKFAHIADHKDKRIAELEEQNEILLQSVYSLKDDRAHQYQIRALLHQKISKAREFLDLYMDTGNSVHLSSLKNSLKQ